MGSMGLNSTQAKSLSLGGGIPASLILCILWLLDTCTYLFCSFEWFSNERKMIFGEVLPENRFWTVTRKIRTHSQNVILSCQFLCRFPRLLSNFHQLNTFRAEQRKIFVKIDFCTAVRFWQISAISLFCVSFSLLFLVFALFPSQNTKRPKIFLLFLFTICLLWFLAFVSLYLLLLVCYKKTQKDFALFACFLLFLFPIRKHQKYLLFFFGL